MDFFTIMTSPYDKRQAPPVGNPLAPRQGTALAGGAGRIRVLAPGSGLSEEERMLALEWKGRSLDALLRREEAIPVLEEALS